MFSKHPQFFCGCFLYYGKATKTCHGCSAISLPTISRDKILGRFDGVRRSAAASLAMVVTTLVVFSLLQHNNETTVQTAIVGIGDFLQTVPMVGTIEYEQKQNCIALRNGKIARVCVEEGQRVKKDELLFVLETTAEENALAKLSQVRYQHQLVQGMGRITDLMAAQNEYQLLAQEAELKQRIEASYARSQADGVVSAVYIKEGMYVEAAALSVVVRGEEKCVKASTDTSELTGINSGTTAVLSRQGRVIGTGKVETVDEPLLMEEGCRQQVSLKMMDAGILDRYETGTTVSVELLTGVNQSQALIPMEAVDMNECVWWIEDNIVHAVKVDVSNHNRQFIALPSSEWEGRQVVLLPEQYELKDGCSVKAVKNAKK